jgi:hypothetical protein
MALFTAATEAAQAAAGPHDPQATPEASGSTLVHPSPATAHYSTSKGKQQLQGPKAVKAM